MAFKTSSFFNPTKAAEIDPLGIDNFMQEITDHNSNSNTPAIANALHVAAEVLPSLPNRADVAMAALRDIDILASSLLRHGINPVETEPRLAEGLKSLGAIAVNIPRGTIATYVGINPSGLRRRHFTSTEEEALFVESLSVGYHLLDTALADISSIKSDSSAAEVADAIGSTSTAVDSMRNSIISVHKNISPEFFTANIRPYFEPLEVDGEVYAAPGGSQLQLLGIEYALWGCDSADEEYAKYFLENLKYLTAEQKQLMYVYLQNNNGISIFTRTLTEADDALTEEVTNVMRSLRKFRYPHKKVAEDNFAIRPEGSVGSGHYTPRLLGHLVVQTNEKLHLLTEDQYVR